MPMDLAAVYHRAGLEFRYFQDSKLTLRVVTAHGDMDRVTLLYDQKYVMGPRGPFKERVMECVATDGIHDWYETSFLPEDPRLHYVFRLEKGEELWYLYETGVTDVMLDIRNSFSFPSILAHDEHDIPEWSRGAVIYQIFVDRFNRVGEPEEGIAPWGTPPLGENGDAPSVIWNLFCGGNLKGITAKADYLKDLGVDVVYLTPIFEADSNHRYDTIDYMKIDPMVGTLEDLRELADALHARGMRLMLDGVFNHSSTKFKPFADLLQKGEDSAYKGWFLYQSLPLDMVNKNYDSFSHGAMMPKLNMTNPEAREYFCNVGRYWIEEGHIDGWRLDVANEIDFDFLRMFRKEVKAAKADALIIGESWVDSFAWLQGDMFDGVMHYPMTFAIRDYFESGSYKTPEKLDYDIQRVHMLYTYAVQQCSWVMLDSHDTSRLLTICDNDGDKMKAAAFLQIMVPGAPFIYYGDEVGLEGGDDPDCRRCMPWDRADGHPMIDYYKKLIAAKHLPAARFGDMRAMAMEDGVYRFKLEYPTGSLLCVVNVTEQPCTLPAGWMDEVGFAPAQELLRGACWQGEIALAPYEGLIFAEEQRPMPPQTVMKAADFRQPFPEEYRAMMQKFVSMRKRKEEEEN